MSEPLKLGDSDTCWKILEQANLGSLYLAKHAPDRKEAQQRGLLPNPIQAEAALRALKRELEEANLGGFVFKDYSWLSEYSHPSLLALRQYVTMDKERMTAAFHSSKSKAQASVAAADVYAVIWMRTAAKILVMAELHTAKRRLDECRLRYVTARQSEKPT